MLAVYNAGGFVASLALPAWADRRDDYLRPMLGCSVLTLLLAGLPAVTTSLPVAVVGLVLLGGPAGVGSSLLFAQLKRSGASPSDVVNTRAIVSFAWVAGPPLAAVGIGAFGDRAVVAAVGVVGVLNIVTSAVMLTGPSAPAAPQGADGEEPRVADGEAAAEPRAGAAPRSTVAVIVLVFVVLQATNSATVSVMSLFVTATLGAPVAWAGIALGAAAALEIPALLLVGRLSGRVPSRWLIASGCVAGVAYYAAMALVRDPVLLVALQALNAWFFAVVAGVGLTLFQHLIPRPGLAAGLYVNTRRLGAIASGPVIGLGSATPLGYGGVFAVCATLTAGALVVTGLPGAGDRRLG